MRELSPDAAKAKILDILENGRIIPTWYHARKRMQQRSVEDADIREALSNGDIKRRAEWDEQHQNWKYRVEGTDLEGEAITLITVIIESDHLLRIITIF